MKVLVTGSEGFIGKNLVARLKADGHEVIAWDIKNGKDFLEHKFPKVDVIYHLACVNQMWATLVPERNLEVNAFGARWAASEAKRITAKLLYCSTASVYGNATEIPTPATAKLDPLTDYAVAKLAGEHFVKNSGCDYTILRLSNVYGPHQTTENPYCGVIGRFIDQWFADEPFSVIGDGLQTRDFSFVDDVVDILLRAGGRGLAQSSSLVRHGGPWNVSSGIESNIYAVCNAINPDWPIQWVVKRPIDGVSRRCLKGIQTRTSLTDGIKKTVEWYRMKA